MTTVVGVGVGVGVEVVGAAVGVAKAGPAVAAAVITAAAAAVTVVAVTWRRGLDQRMADMVAMAASMAQVVGARGRKARSQ